MTRISKKYNISKVHMEDSVASELFLRTSRDILDEEVSMKSLDKVRGALRVLEECINMRDEVKVDREMTKGEVDAGCGVKSKSFLADKNKI